MPKTLFFLNQNKETCSDGIQNQGETGIDCGGPCPKCDDGKINYL